MSGAVVVSAGASVALSPPSPEIRHSYVYVKVQVDQKYYDILDYLHTPQVAAHFSCANFASHLSFFFTFSQCFVGISSAHLLTTPENNHMESYILHYLT